MSALSGLLLNGRKKRIVVFASLAGVIIIMLVIVGLRTRASNDPSRQLYKVRKMTIRVVVTEEGVLKAKESEKIIPDIDSEAKIISVVEEGEYVEEGEKLVELDKSGIEARLESLDLELISAKADMDIAEEEVKKYEKGEYPQKIKELDFAIEKAKAKLAKAEDEMPKETNSGIYSTSEIRDAQITRDEAAMNLEKAQLDRRIYEEYTHKKNVLEKKTKANTARKKYESKVQQRSDLIAQLDKMVLRAPCPGLVIYGGGGERRRWRDQELTIKVGALVYKGQVIITLPNVSKMQVQARVHEVDIEKIKEGQPVNIRIDAFPDMALTGEVEQIGALAHDRDWRTQGVKVFDVTIDIDGTHKKLRPGMTAKADIQVETIKDALAIPIEAVFEDPEKNEKYCFVKEAGRPGKRVIELGKSDENFVVVKKGLSAGELVYQYNVAHELNLR